jgi:hypothetical protein
MKNYGVAMLRETRDYNVRNRQKADASSEPFVLGRPYLKDAELRVPAQRGVWSL